MDWSPIIKGVIALLAISLGAIITYRISQREMHAPLDVDRQVGLAGGGAEDPGLPAQVWAVLAAIPEVPIVVSHHGRVLLPRAQAVAWGLVNSEEITNPDALNLVNRVRNEGGVHKTEIVTTAGQVPGSGPIHLQLRASHLSPGYVLLLVTDTTEARRLAQMRQDFVADASHELKTPVGALGLLAETIADNPDNPEMVQKFAASMQAETKRLGALVQDIIALNRLESAATQEPERVNLRQIVADACQEMMPAAATAGKSVTMKLPEEARIMLRGRGDQLQTAVRNLIDNALRYGGEGAPVEVELKILREDEPETLFAQVSVADNGEGVPPELRERVFERFFRADPARARETGGTGLGLSIVKHTCVNHRGRVWVEDAPSGGALFVMELPIEEAK